MASSTTIQIPLRLYNLEGRYATALYSAATKKNTLNSVESELIKIKTAIQKSSQLQSFLRDPLLRREQKRDSVLSILKSQNYSETIINFFKIIADNGRLANTSKIIGSFEDIMRAHRHEVSVKITSAKELSSEQLEALSSIIKKSLSSKEHPKLLVIVDPKILGGIMIEIGDKTIDLSVITRLNAINKSLEESIYQ